MKCVSGTKTLSVVLAAAAFAMAPLASHAQTVTVTQNFTTSPPNWTAVMQPGSGNDFGWSNTGFASGTAGEAGGTIARSSTFSTYTTAVTNLDRKSTLTMSGTMYVQNQNFDGGFYFGFFDSANFATTSLTDFVGFIATEPGGGAGGAANPFRGYPWSVDNPTVEYNGPYDLTQSQQLPFNLTYTGSSDGSGTLTGTLNGFDIGTLSTAAGTSTFNAFGLAMGGAENPNSSLRATVYFDNVSYTSGLNLYWDNADGGADSWGDAANWSTTVGGGSTPSAAAGAGDVARFSATPIVGVAQTVNLGADQSVLGLVVESAVTQGITFQGGGENRTLSIGGSGVTNASNGAGAITIGSTTAGENVNVTLVGSQSWANNGTQEIIVQNTVSGSGTPTFTNSGTGTGAVRFNASISSTVSKVVQDSATSRLVLGGANTYSGPTTISAGTLELSAGGSFDNSSTITVASGGRLDLEAKTAGFTFGPGQTLAGAGSVALPTSGTGVSLAGFLGPGTLTAGTLAFTGAGTFDIMSAIDGNTGRLEFGLAAPGVSDLVTVASGTLTIGSGLLNFDDFSFTNLGGLAQGTYTLFSYNSLSGTLGSSLSGSISGGYTGTLQTSGNTIQLVVVPEPAGIAVAGLGVAAAAWALRRRR